MIDVFVGALALSTFFNILISMAPRWRIPHAPRSTPSSSCRDGNSYHSADSVDSGYEDARTNQLPATAQHRIMPNPSLKRQQQQQLSADRSRKKQRGTTFPKDNNGRPTTIGYASREERQWCDQRARDIKGDVCYRCKQDGHKAQTCKMPATSG